MAFTLNNNFISSAAYNSLPRLTEVASVAKDHADDINALRSLLTKHNVPRGVSVRLIHKHFDTTDGEIMALKEVSVLPYGTVYSLGPLKHDQEPSELRPVHYFLDEADSFQAYEYTSAQVPDLSGYESFLAEFGTLLKERGLQQKLGLKLSTKMDETGWVEFEFAGNRSTVIFPEGMPIPEGMNPDSEFNITTEWGEREVDGPALKRSCILCNKSCRSHPIVKSNHPQQEPAYYLGGQKVFLDTPVHAIIKAVIGVY